MTKYILGIDSGTTSVRSFVVDEAGTVVGFGQQNSPSTIRARVGSSTTPSRS